MKKRFFLLVALGAMLVSSCGFHETHTAITEDGYDLVDEALDLMEVNVDRDIDTTPLTIEQENPYTDLTQSLYDFDDYKNQNSDLIFTVVDKNAIREAPNALVSDLHVTADMVSLYDNRGHTFEFKTFVEGDGQATFSFSSSIFDRHNVYYLELKNDRLVFQGKDDDIRTLTFYTMNRGLQEGKTVDYKDDIVDLDSTKVYYYDEDGYSPYFVYKEALDLEPGTTFRLRHPDLQEDDIETVYGKIISINVNANGAGFLVRYNPAKGEDIFTSLSIFDQRSLSEDDRVIYYNTDDSFEDQVANAIIHNPSTVLTVYALFNAFGVEEEAYRKSVIDWGSRIDVSVNTSYDISANAFTLAVGASYTFYPTNNLTITLKFSYKQTWSFDVTASVSIETEFLIPVGIDYTFKVVEDTQKEIYFGMCLSYDHAGEYDEKKTEESINKALMDAFNDRSDWQKRSVFKGEEASATKGGAVYPLFKIICTYFLPIEIYFEIDFYWEIVPTLEIIIKYTSHTQRVDLCVSDSGGSKPSSDSATKTNSALSFAIIGKVHLEVGVRVSLGVDIIGLYKFFHVEVYLTIYGAIDFEGYFVADLSWNDGQPVSANLQLGCKFEISCGLKVGFDLYLLFGGYNHEFPIVGVVLFGVEAAFPVQEFTNPVEDCYLTNTDYNESKNYFNLTLGERHLLGARVFNSSTFQVEIKDMEYDDYVNAMYGAFVPNDIKKQIFNVRSITVKEGELKSNLEVSSDGHITMQTIAGQDNFVAEIVIEVNSSCTMASDLTKTIVVHFDNNDRQSIKIDDKNYGSFVDGAIVKLPVPDSIRYKKFIGYYYKNKDGAMINIDYDEAKPEEFIYEVDTTGDFRNCSLVSRWIDYYHWEVYFMDGLNNLIEKQMVFYGEDAVEPNAEKRDHYMNQNPPDENHHYEFVGWDQPFTNISGPTVIRAKYRIVAN